MVLNREELISLLKTEVRLILHLVSKVEPGMLDYRPAPQQRSLLELVQYLTLMPPIHTRAVMADAFDNASFGRAWNEGEAVANSLTLEQAAESIGQQPALFDELIGARPDEEMRAEMEMFGQKASRGFLLVSLVLSHYAAYRMQLFLYLKASGRGELNTMNLWVGRDAG